jgi:endo-1,3-1,4-beta-glycanase ExoK
MTQHLFYIRLIGDYLSLRMLRPIIKSLLLLLVLCSFLSTALAQECIGGAIYSQETYLYGRFEVRMQSVAGDGYVSSFFLYNLDDACNWPEENNEIDIEMTGNNEWIQFTTHYPSLTYHTDIFVPDFNPHAAFHDYAIEWEPGIVRWFVDGELANVQDEPYVEELIHPLEIIMNCWASEAVGWVGVWDPDYHAGVRSIRLRALLCVYTRRRCSRH